MRLFNTDIHSFTHLFVRSLGHFAFTELLWNITSFIDLSPVLLPGSRFTVRKFPSEPNHPLPTTAPPTLSLLSENVLLRS